MNRAKIERHNTLAAGYHPLVLSSGWQVAQLNDREDLHADSLAEIERHTETDEIFVLVRGHATLIEATLSEGVHFECTHMEKGVVYNVPRGVWHAIKTEPGMLVIIVERDGTHLQDVEHRHLTEREQTLLRAKMQCSDLHAKGE